MAFPAGKRRGIRLNKRLKSIITNSRIELAARWILGLIFIYASFHKMVFPAEFAKIIYGYDLFPAVLINLIAIITPFLELITGLALILGFYPRSAALIINAMLLVFITVLSINLIRGHEFDCGCFSAGKANSKTSAGFSLFQDFLLLAMGLQVYFYSGTRPRRFVLKG
jgi:uncharacterized membrane protein YphA (DoxX/SURF4 family)